jgi:hypothetical protein
MEIIWGIFSGIGGSFRGSNEGSNGGSKGAGMLLASIVDLIELEYFGISAVQMLRYDKFSKLVYCITGPQMFTATAREFVMRQLTNGNETKAPLRTHYRLASRDFLREGVNFKWASTVGDKSHYSFVGRAKFLSHYAPDTTEAVVIQRLLNSSQSFNGILAKSSAQGDVYVLRNGSKRRFESVQVLEAHNYSLAAVHTWPDFILKSLPNGPSFS